MAETTHAGRWTYRGVFLALAALVIFAKLLPLHPGPGRFPGPDILILMACAWVVRRPDFLPVTIVVADQVARELRDTDLTTKQQIIELLGTVVYDDSGLSVVIRHPYSLRRLICPLLSFKLHFVH